MGIIFPRTLADIFPSSINRRLVPGQKALLNSILAGAFISSSLLARCLEPNFLQIRLKVRSIYFFPPSCYLGSSEHRVAAELLPSSAVLHERI